MAAEAEHLIIEIIRTHGEPMTVAEIRKAFRSAGRVLTEDFIRRTCASSTRLRLLAGDRFAVLSQLLEEANDDAEIGEKEQSNSDPTVKNLAVLSRGSYVVVDIETTGIDPDTDAIIQIGAVRVERGQISGIFFEPVNPGSRGLTSALRRLLDIPEGGVMDRLIASAPSPSEVLPRFLEFAGDSVLVAHNGTALDFPFLQSHGLASSHPVVDSLEVAYLACPDIEHHNLAALAEAFGIGPDSKELLDITRAEPRVEGARAHNALYDSALLVLILRELIQRIEGEVRGATCYGRVLAALLADVLGEGNQQPAYISLDDLRTALFPEEGSDLFENGPARSGEPPVADEVVRRFHEYSRAEKKEPRASQDTMVRLVAQTLADGGLRVIEAPTGTGKSLALAFPAATYAVASGRRVLISTHTRNLQQQLVGEIEDVRKRSGLNFRYCVLQGRGNYLCVTALLEHLREALGDSPRLELPLEERFCLAVALGWAMAQASSAGEGNLDGVAYPLRRRFGAMNRLLASVSATRNRCRDDRCRPSNGCYRGRARARARAADLLVVNHALWLSPGLDVLPEFDSILLDEAHELENAATSAFSEEATRDGISGLLAEILAPGDRLGILPRLLGHSGRSSEIGTRCIAAIATVREARVESRVFAEQLTNFLHRIGYDPSAEHGVVLRLRFESRRAYPTRWRAFQRSAESLNAALRSLGGRLASLAGLVETDTESAIFASELFFLSERILETCQTLESILGNRDSRYVSWIEAREDANSENSRTRPRLSWALRRAPISVGAKLSSRILQARAAILTSATITVRGGDFGFILDRTGLAESTPSSHLHRLPPALDYSNALLLLPRYLDHVPLGASLPFFTQEFARELVTLFSFTQGRGLVLFTARSRLQEVKENSEPALAAEGITVFYQQEGANREFLRREFAEDEHSVLLGLRSFWHGVDVPGAACSFVVIEKLPFPALGDPVVEARRESVAAGGKSEFEDYLLPLSLLEFKQGFGRLLRNASDRGAILMMDRRIHSRSYKSDLLATLPGYSRRAEVEDSRRETYRAIAEHLPDLFAGRDVAALIDALPDMLISEIADAVARWDLPSPLSDEEYLSMREDILAFMQRVFAFAGFRSAEQEAIVRNVLCGRDVIGLLPTGAGKSLTFQLPALLRRGLTLVISPLIALMRDQVERLHALRLDMVDAITSHMSGGERDEVLRRARAGRLRLLYVSPERLRDSQLQSALRECNVIHVVIDEAHCVSMWGPTFRPDYVNIAPALSAVTPRAPMAALTATATNEIEGDIRRRLAMREPVVIRGSFDRPEIRYVVYDWNHAVYPIRSGNDKFKMMVLLARTAERRSERMIVYTSTTKTAEEVARRLAATGFAARAYHGQMPADERSEVQELFIDDQLTIVVATKAFGMGIDKPDIRYVVHYDVPGDLESYLQESGRVGRDGQPAWAVLFFHRRDLRVQDFFIESMRLDPKQLEPLMHSLAPRVKAKTPIELAELADETGIEEEILRVAIYRLEEAGWLKREQDVVLQASVTLLEDEKAILNAKLPESTVSALRRLLDCGHLPVMRRTTVSIVALADAAGMTPEAADGLLAMLAVRGIAAYRPFERAMRLTPGAKFETGAIAAALDEPLIQRKHLKLKRMVEYASNRTICRRGMLLRYLGQENVPEHCEGCDVCVPGLEKPWSHERVADIPNPSELFDPTRVALNLIDSNVARAREEERGPLGRVTLKCVLLGNAYPILQREKDPYLRSWKDRRLRSFHEWGLLASIPRGGETIEEVFDRLIREGLVVERQGGEGDFSYSYLTTTERGYRVLSGIEP